MSIQVNVGLFSLCVSAANLSGGPGGAPERPFVRATSLLHSHFCNTETLQEAIIRSVRQWGGGGGLRGLGGGGVLVFHGSSSRSRGWWFIITSHQSLLFLHTLLQLTFTEKGNLSRVFTVTRLSALRCVNLHAWNVNVPLQECRSCCVWDPQRGSGDLLPAARGIVQELGHP